MIIATILNLHYLSEVLTIPQTVVSYSYDIYTHIFTCLPDCVRIVFCSIAKIRVQIKYVSFFTLPDY